MMSAIDFQFSSDDSDHTPDDTGTSVWQQNYQGSKHVFIDYVQPDSTLSLNDAVSRAAPFWSYGRGWGSTPTFTASVCVAEQIPFDHPSHKKLGELMLAYIEQSKNLMTETQRASCYDEDSVWNAFISVLQESVHEPEVPDLDDEQGVCATYMNLCAFAANLTFPESHKMRFDHPLALHALEEADRKSLGYIGDDRTLAAEVRDVRLIGAAQYILVRAQTIYYEAVENQKREDELDLEEDKLEGARGCFARLVQNKRKYKLKNYGQREKKRRFSRTFRFTLEQWQTWKEMFRTAALDETLGENCREIAQRVVDLMALQEKAHSDSLSKTTS